MSCISLTTDFGVDDWFVGTMKGVIHSKSTTTTVIDLTHGIPRGDIRAGAFALMAGYQHFPKQTVHVAVIDPGVGSERSANAVDTANYFFVGPDNGVLSWALQHEEIRAIHRLENPDCFLNGISATFHGRDVFAPVAADIANGIEIAHLGRAMDKMEMIHWPPMTKGDGGLEGEIVYLDVYGNGITNISNVALGTKEEANVRIGEELFGPLKECYNAVELGQPVAVRGSSGLLELAVNRGSAAASHGLEVGSLVSVTPNA